MAQPRRAVLLLFPLAMLLFAVSCEGFWVSNSSIQSVTVSPSAVLLQAGASPADTYTFSSTAITVGGSQSDDTATATWSSSDTTVATAAAGGVVTAATTSSGQTATITATDSGKSGSATVLTYTGQSPTTLNLGYTLPTGVTPTTIPLGTSFPVTATGSLNGNTTYALTNYVTWTLSNNTAGATISGSTVTVPSTGTHGGSFTVNATLTLGTTASPNTVTGSLPFTVQ